jgi:hypothetical protein
MSLLLKKTLLTLVMLLVLPSVAHNNTVLADLCFSEPCGKPCGACRVAGQWRRNCDTTCDGCYVTLCEIRKCENCDYIDSFNDVCQAAWFCYGRTGCANAPECFLDQ